MRKYWTFFNKIGHIALVVVFLNMWFSFGPVKAAGESVTAPSDTTVINNQDNLALSDDFQVSGFAEDANLLVSITVSGSTSAKVNLPTTTGLTLESGYSSWTNTSQINFTGTQANVNAALDAMTLNSGATNGAATLSIEVSEKVNNTAFYNGHLYEFVPGNISYLNARSAARLRTINGVNGYLVTITSDEEHNFVLSKIQGAYNIWIALSDRAVEGDWVLDPHDGSPEQGTLVWRGLSNGSAQGGNYAKWCSGEPNNSGNEDAAVTKWNGGNCWNDLPDSYSSVGGYVAEYNMPASVVVSDSMVVTIESRTLNAPTNLAVSFNGTMANLTWNAPAASNTPVERYAVSWSTDNFASGFAIASQTTSASISNLVRGTTYQFRVRADNDTYSTYSSYTSSVSATAPQEGNTITFSYNPTTVTQNVQISTTNKTTLLATVRATSIEGSPDLFFVGIELRGVGGGLIYSHNTGWVNLTNSYQDITLTVTASGVGAEAWALVDSVTLVLGGDDAEFWAGNYGPRVESASLKLDGTELMSNVEFADGDRYWISSAGWQTCHATQGNKPCASAGLYVAPTTTVPPTTVYVPPVTTTTEYVAPTTTTTTTVYVPPVTTTTEPETTTTTISVPVPETTVPEPEEESTPESTLPTPNETEITQPTSPASSVPQQTTPTLLPVQSTTPQTPTTIQETKNQEKPKEQEKQPSTTTLPEIKEILAQIPKQTTTLTDEDKEKIASAVSAIIESGISAETAKELASNPAVLQSVSTEQAQEIFTEIEPSRLSEEAAQSIVDAVQDAPEEIRSVFENAVDLFQGAFDSYKMLGQTIDVGQRRTVVAVNLVTTVSAAAAAMSVNSSSSGSPSSGSSSASAKGDVAARKEEEEEAAGEIAGDGLEWIKQLSIYKIVNGEKVMDWKAFFKKFSYGLMNLGWTLAGSLIVYLTLSGTLQTIAGIASVMALASAMYLHMKEPDDN